MTSKTVRDGKKPLFGATSGLPLSLSHLPRCPYRYETLELDGLGDVEVGEGPHTQERLPRGSQTAPRIAIASIRIKRKAVIIGDFLLKETEGPVCCLDPSHREVCCLLCSLVRDVARNITRLVKPSDYYPLEMKRFSTLEMKFSTLEMKR